MISVITSCYNSNPDYLRESIKSILGQTYQDFEFLIADNGAGLNLKEFLAQFNDSRIKYIDNGGNIGPTKSYDNLAELAKGKYVALQDHDDISLPNRLEVEKKALDNEPEIMSLSGKIHIFGKYEKDDGEGMPPEQVKQELIFWQTIKQPTFMKRKEFCKQYKYNPEFMIYDYEFWSRTRKVPHRILDKIVLKYRKSAGNSTKERAHKVRAEHAKIVQRNLKLLKIDAPIEMCSLLDPYNHTKQPRKYADLFLTYKDKLLKHISQKLFERKLNEIISKTY